MADEIEILRAEIKELKRQLIQAEFFLAREQEGNDSLRDEIKESDEWCKEHHKDSHLTRGQHEK